MGEISNDGRISSVKECLSHLLGEKKAGPVKYATEAAKAGLPVPMNLSKAHTMAMGKGASIIPSRDLASMAGGVYRALTPRPLVITGPGDRESKRDSPIKTLQQQKDAVKLLVGDDLPKIFPSGDGRTGHGERHVASPGGGWGYHVREPDHYRIAADQMEEMGQTAPAEGFRRLGGLNYDTSPSEPGISSVKECLHVIEYMAGRV